MAYSDEIIRRASGHKDLKAYRNYVKLDPVAVMTLVRSNESGSEMAILVDLYQKFFRGSKV